MCSASSRILLLAYVVPASVYYGSCSEEIRTHRLYETQNIAETDNTAMHTEFMHILCDDYVLVLCMHKNGLQYYYAKCECFSAVHDTLTHCNIDTTTLYSCVSCVHVSVCLKYWCMQDLWSLQCMARLCCFMLH